MRGFQDILPPLSYKIDLIKEEFEKILKLYCVDMVHLPLVEDADLYFRTAGEEADICNKELFEVRKFKGEFENWVLRPEGTASCARALIESHFLDSRKHARLAYCGPMFRYNRPQLGRYRQFYQAGVEFIGLESVYSDYEVIMLAIHLLNKLNVNFTLEINSIGNATDRKFYREELKKLFNCSTDPLKILDKLENFESIPSMKLNANDENRFTYLFSKLQEINLNVKHNPYLVRGLDYYNGIVFEFKVDQGHTILAGGRYDLLFSHLGGVYTPSVGFALGVDRLAAFMPEIFNIKDIAIISLCEDEYALRVLNSLRSENFNCAPYFMCTDLAKVLKTIGKEFKFAIIIGESEKEKNELLVKNLSERTQFIKKFSEISRTLFQNCGN